MEAMKILTAHGIGARGSFCVKVIEDGPLADLVTFIAPQNWTVPDSTNTFSVTTVPPKFRWRTWMKAKQMTERLKEREECC
jgi:hypothetical protein